MLHLDFREKNPAKAGFFSLSQLCRFTSHLTQAQNGQAHQPQGSGYGDFARCKAATVTRWVGVARVLAT
jgi:hypothetical protein